MARIPQKPYEKFESFDALFKQSEDRLGYWVEGAILEYTDEIRRKLDALGMSRGELAAKLEQSPPQVSRLLSGRNNFTLRTMVALARAVNCSLRLHLQSDGTHTAWRDYALVKPQVQFETRVPRDLLAAASLRSKTPSLPITLNSQSLTADNRSGYHEEAPLAA